MATRPWLPCAAFFKLSHISAPLSKRTGATAQKQRFHCQQLLWLWLQNGSWAVAQGLGQLPLWIHGTIWATAHISCMVLTTTGGLGQPPCGLLSPLPSIAVCISADGCVDLDGQTASGTRARFPAPARWPLYETNASLSPPSRIGPVPRWCVWTAAPSPHSHCCPGPSATASLSAPLICPIPCRHTPALRRPNCRLRPRRRLSASPRPPSARTLALATLSSLGPDPPPTPTLPSRRRAPSSPTDLAPLPRMRPSILIAPIPPTKLGCDLRATRKRRDRHAILYILLTDLPPASVSRRRQRASASTPLQLTQHMHSSPRALIAATSVAIPRRIQLQRHCRLRWTGVNITFNWVTVRHSVKMLLGLLCNSYSK